MRKYSQNLDNETDGLIDSLIGEHVNSSEPNEEDQSIKPSSSVERYQSPIQGSFNIIGYFSPNQATDVRHPKGHMGVDLQASRGTPIYPIASGIVKDVEVGEKSGNYVMCLHENNQVQSFYAHLDSVSVKQGQQVDQKTVIGTVGTTGNASTTSPHLHYEIKVNGSLVNPLSITGKDVSLAKQAQLLLNIEKYANEFYSLMGLIG